MYLGTWQVRGTRTTCIATCDMAAAVLHNASEVIAPCRRLTCKVLVDALMWTAGPAWFNSKYADYSCSRLLQMAWVITQRACPLRVCQLFRYGRLGVGGTPDILPPSVIGGLRGCTVVQVACGTAHTLALTTDGRVYAWGYNGQGAVGTGDDQDRLVPTLVGGCAGGSRAP